MSPLPYSTSFNDQLSPGQHYFSVSRSGTLKEFPIGAPRYSEADIMYSPQIPHAANQTVHNYTQFFNNFDVPP